MALIVRRVGRGAGLAAAPGLGGDEAGGQAPGGKAASGGLMVMVTVQPGCSFCSWRSSQACFCPGDSRRVQESAPGSVYGTPLLSTWYVFFLMMWRPPRSTLFPYTTFFR